MTAAETPKKEACCFIAKAESFTGKKRVLLQTVEHDVLPCIHLEEGFHSLSQCQGQQKLLYSDMYYVLHVVIVNVLSHRGHFTSNCISTINIAKWLNVSLYIQLPEITKLLCVKMQ